MDTNNNCHKKFSCNLCNYFTSNKKDLNKHIVTIKHTKQIIPNINSPKNPLSICECKCGKVYKHKSSLSLHKKTCADKKELENKELSEPTEKELILLLLKDNKALQELVIEQSKNMMEICKNGTNNTTNTNSNNNITNKTFNLQFFLNEECKDALNISDFVSSIKMDLDD